MAKKTRSQYSTREQEGRVDKCREHKRAWKFQEELEKNYIDKEGSLHWLKIGILSSDGERIIVGAQNQGLLTNGFKKMARISDNDLCRFYLKQVESTNHLVSGCETLLADGYYTARCNKICKHLHWKICKGKKMKVNDNI